MSRSLEFDEPIELTEGKSLRDAASHVIALAGA
jgi:hypothetical protein